MKLPKKRKKILMQLHHFFISYLPTIRPKQKYYAEIFNSNMRKKNSLKDGTVEN